MHDPSVLLFDFPPFELRCHLPEKFRYRRLLEVWHEEPDGRDAGEVCKGPRGSRLSWHNIRWAWQHRDHLTVRVIPWGRLKSWLFDRCADCGRRFFWGEARFGYMSSDRSYHEPCINLRQVRTQLDDATKYIAFDANDTERWRVERRLDVKQTAKDADDG